MNPVLWQPSSARRQNANITRFMKAVRERYGVNIAEYHALYQWTIENPAAFWDLLWDFAGIKAAHKGKLVLAHQERMPGAKWFPEARLNYAENLLRQCDKRRFAISFQGENGATRRLSYSDLYRQVSRLAQALKNDNVRPGDRVAGVLPNLPEAIIAMLATASLGAVWSSCSPDFGVAGILDRFSQIEPKVLFVCDGYTFNGKAFARQDQLEPLLKALPSVQTTVLIPYLNSESFRASHQVALWQDYLGNFPENRLIEFMPMAFDDPLFILYSSGTTGPPKCIVHGVGGTLIQHLKEHLLHVDIHPGERLFYYTTCGWMMWNWLASALAAGAELVLYDGAPLYPKADALFDLIDEFQITVFGVSAKYIDALKKFAVIPKKSHHLSSLKSILSTGSPLAPEAFDFVYESVKSDVCLSSISGGTDIISCFVLGCPVLPVRRGEIQCRGLAMNVDVFDDNGRPLLEEKGELVCKAPFPSMPVGFWNDPDQRRYHAAYFEKFPGVWRHGDYVALTDSGGMIIYGRSDAVLNPGGVRIGTAEIYRQVEQLDEVLESLVVGQDVDGDCRIILFVVLPQGEALSEQLKTKIKQQIRQNASPRHVPSEILQVSAIPRTKNGKIAELAVRNIIHGQPVKNQHALANPEALEQYYRVKELIN
ncbi:Acetoacetyl-coenzyme A synthetase [Candidatus Methylobacter favarea]|uniref:Acetoacetyl-coenzyme A synthetase n=1 Tax=Candidatus Methylobacter favarea TaxID=2707345 RepID=A0A8S0WMR5_9GAMM|nr:acetoacetate--CoA ligase [Candidatus Methylobacter favarea]CAA9889932.1 Acetoacetyl-coenzyme A synthetase [Candidatus Methylobacter favarea]